jgi:hypothetical protein
MRQCTNCGSRASDEARFCAHCGLPLAEADEPRRLEEQPETPIGAAPSAPTASSLDPKPAPNPSPSRTDSEKNAIGCGVALLGLVMVLTTANIPSVGGALVVLGLLLGLGGLAYAPVVATWAESAQKSAQRQEEEPLRKATGSWTSLVVVRSYHNDKDGLKIAEREANILAAHGYAVAAQSGAGSHINVGRTASAAFVTGGLSLLFGASRSKGTIQITFTKTS